MAAFSGIWTTQLWRRLLQQPLRPLLLAFNAMSRPRHCLQARGVYFLAAGDTFPKVALTNSIERALDHLQELTVIVALVEEKFLGIGARGAVGDILCRILIYGTAILLRTRNHAPQILLLRYQPLPEIIQLLLFHTK